MTKNKKSITDPEDFSKPVPVYFNPGSGSSEKMLATIQNDARVVLRKVLPEKLTEVLKKAIDQGEKRVLISGGDGTIALAASRLAGQDTELGIIPSGTLNHFAQRTGIPTNTDEAVKIALNGKAQPVDVGSVNDRLFINTSSVGAYPVFVRSREYLETRMHYLSASVLAGIRRLINFRSVRVILQDKELRTPLVFIGVGERQLHLPALGQEKKNGRNGLHFFAVDCDNKMQIFILVMKSFFLGIDPMKKELNVLNQMVNDIELNFSHRKRMVTVALDGELHQLHAPLQYKFVSGSILVALPDE